VAPVYQCWLKNEVGKNELIKNKIYYLSVYISCYFQILATVKCAILILMFAVILMVFASKMHHYTLIVTLIIKETCLYSEMALNLEYMNIDMKICTNMTFMVIHENLENYLNDSDSLHSLLHLTT